MKNVFQDAGGVIDKAMALLFNDAARSRGFKFIRITQVIANQFSALDRAVKSCELINKLLHQLVGSLSRFWFCPYVLFHLQSRRQSLELVLFPDQTARYMPITPREHKNSLFQTAFLLPSLHSILFPPIVYTRQFFASIIPLNGP